MEPKGLTLAPEADRRTLIRRLTFDLAAAAVARGGRGVRRDDRSGTPTSGWSIGCSPRRSYGERWGRHWLDVARYADSDGYESDLDRQTAYRYRDFVIQALNADMPFDRFVRWQIAGDEDAPDDPAALAATGFCTAAAQPGNDARPTPRRTRPRSATTSWTTCSRRSGRACSA